MKIVYASDTGRMRAENQDYVSVFINRQESSYYFADGVVQNGGVLKDDGCFPHW